MSAIPWRLIGYGAGVIVLVALLWWVQARIRVSYQAELERDQAVKQHAAYKEFVEASAVRAAARMESDQADDAELATKLAALTAEEQRLVRALATTKPTVEKPDANGIPRLSLNPDWWLCVSTFVTRDPAASAACEAGPGSSGLPNPVSH